MAEEQIYIAESCSIFRGVVRKAGTTIFQQSETDVPAFFLSVYRHFKIDYPKFYKMDNLSKLGFLATELLLQNTIGRDQLQPKDTGIVFANANASLDADLSYWQSVKNIPSPALFVYTLPNIVIGEICIRNNFKGENAFFIQQEFDPAFLHFYVSDLLSRHSLKRCICGWLDVLGENYKAMLWLVTSGPAMNGIPFTFDSINNLYQSDNG